MLVADASMLFSTSSLMAEARSTMTWPEAILSTVDRAIALIVISTPGPGNVKIFMIVIKGIYSFNTTRLQDYHYCTTGYLQFHAIGIVFGEHLDRADSRGLDSLQSGLQRILRRILLYIF